MRNVRKLVRLIKEEAEKVERNGEREGEREREEGGGYCAIRRRSSSFGRETKRMLVVARYVVDHGVDVGGELRSIVALIPNNGGFDRS